MARDYRTEYAEDFRILNERYNGVETYIKGMANGGIRSLIVNGPPGVGKTHSVKTYLDLYVPNNYIHINSHLSLMALYGKLYDFRDKGKVIVLDDVDTIFSKVEGLNLLKAAMDTTSVRQIHWDSPTHYLNTMGLPKNFEFNGSVILISNIGFGGGNGKLVAHLSALKDRSYCSHIAETGEDSLFKQVCFMVLERNLFSSLGIPEQHQMMLLEYIDENKKRLNTVSLRTVVKLSTIFTIDPKNWRTMANQGLLKA
jgi:hypothetical protein